MSEELKPCHFCGAKGEVLHGDQGWWPYCSNDSCFLSNGPEYGDMSMADAVKAWNTRKSIQISEIDGVIEELSKESEYPANGPGEIAAYELSIKKLQQLIKNQQ
jgi:hypothetical protein